VLNSFWSSLGGSLEDLNYVVREDVDEVTSDLEENNIPSMTMIDRLIERINTLSLRHSDFDIFEMKTSIYVLTWIAHRLSIDPRNQLSDDGYEYIQELSLRFTRKLEELQKGS